MKNEYLSESTMHVGTYNIGIPHGNNLRKHSIF